MIQVPLPNTQAPTQQIGVWFREPYPYKILKRKFQMEHENYQILSDNYRVKGGAALFNRASRHRNPRHREAATRLEFFKEFQDYFELKVSNDLSKRF